MSATAPGGLDLAAIQTYLRGRIGSTDLAVTRLTRNVGGMSRETWFADVEGTLDGSPFSDAFTFRLDHPGGAVVPVRLEREYLTFAALTGTVVPVAEALWYEEDPALIGRAPFYVRRTLAGSGSVGWLYKPGNEQIRRTLGAQLARALAAVHTLDWRAAGLAEFMAVPTDAPDCALLELSRWQGHYQANEPELFGWLRRNVPQRVDRVSLCWGDVGVGNFIYDGDQLVGLTDWEQAHIGDPMKDWAFALWRGIEGLLPREEMFAIYSEASGIPIDANRLHYYEVFVQVESCCNTLPVLRGFHAPDTREVTFARMGMGIPYSCMAEAMRALDR